MKQPQDKLTVDLDDIFLWPDNDVYYYRYEVTEELIRFKGMIIALCIGTHLSIGKL